MDGKWKNVYEQVNVLQIFLWKNLMNMLTMVMMMMLVKIKETFCGSMNILNRHFMMYLLEFRELWV